MSEDTPKVEDNNEADSTPTVTPKPKAKPKTPKLTVDTINDASTGEIRAFAEKEVGLKFEEGTSRDFMLEQIFDGMAWLRKDPTADATHVYLKIGLGTGDDGQRDVRLGCNGRMMTVQREKEVKVPVAFYNVLQDINTLGYEIPPLDRQGKLLSETPSSVRIPKTKYPVQVLKFVNEGTAKPKGN